MATPLPASCPCGRQDARGRPLVLSACCGRFLDAGQVVPDAESLMRSRYSAHVLGRADWLLSSWHASTRPAELATEPGARWLGLQVRAHRIVDDAHAEVEFVARWRSGGRGMRQHELSRFVREAGQWWYLDGDML